MSSFTPPTKTSKKYFTQETEDAIIEYNQNFHNPIKQSRIYDEKIHYSFFKLTQNIIHTFKFYNTDVDNLEHLQQEIIIYLLEKLHLFNPSKNVNDKFNKILKEYNIENIHESFLEFNNNKVKTSQKTIKQYINKFNNLPEECLEKLNKITPPKAYSYFGTAVKRWLILYNRENYNKKNNKESVSAVYNSINQSYTIDNKNNELNTFINEYIKYCYKNIDYIFHSPNDKKIADSILHIFSNRHLIDEFNKKAIYIYIREQIPKCNTNNITKVSRKLQKIFYRNYNSYLETGILKFF